METLKKIKSTDASPILKVSYDALYSSLKRLLPAEEMIFAEPKKGVDQIFWVHPEGGWQSFAEADPTLQGMIISQIVKHQSTIQSTLASQPNFKPLMDSLFTIPGEEFYYFKFTEGDGIDVMITGWGYKKPVVKAAGVGAISAPRTKKQRVVASFSSHGQKVPHYAFILHVKYLNNVLNKETDGNGEFLLAEQAVVGAEYMLEDPLTGKTFDLIVEEGKELYDYDITIEVEEKKPAEEQPETKEPEGEHVVEPKEPEVEKVVVPEVPKEPETEEPRPTEPEKPEEKTHEEEPHEEEKTDKPIVPSLRVIGADADAMDKFPVCISYEGQQRNFITDEQGIIQLPPMITGKTMTAEDGISHETRTSYLLEADRLEYTFQVPYKARQANRDILIRTEDVNGQPFSGKIAFCQEGRPTVLSKLDETGQCWLDNNDFLPGEDLIAKMTAAKAISTPVLPDVPFRLKSGEKEYLLSLRKPQRSKTLLEILLAILGFIFFLLAFILLIV